MAAVSSEHGNESLGSMTANICYLDKHKLLCTMISVSILTTGKVKLLRHEGVWGSGCIDPHFLDLGTSRRWVVSFMDRPLYPKERAAGTHWREDWVGPRCGLDDMEKWKFLPLLWLEPRPLGRPVCSQPLYWLRYQPRVVTTFSLIG
jgi:hypothetical protein